MFPNIKYDIVSFSSRISCLDIFYSLHLLSPQHITHAMIASLHLIGTERWSNCLWYPNVLIKKLRLCDYKFITIAYSLPIAKVASEVLINHITTSI
jgi:hypothetical protein